MLRSAVNKKRVVGLALFAVILALFFSFNRFPKLDTVGGDLAAVTAPEVQCFQGFCIEREEGKSFLSRWWVFSVTYLRLVTVGMTFAFVVAGLTEAFLFPTGSGKTFRSGSVFGRTVRGLAVGPVMNLCSACIVPVSSAFRKRGVGIEGSIAMVQGSATMNIPALAMVFFVFTPLLGFSRLVLAVVGGLIIGPLVVLAVRGRGGDETEEPVPVPSAEEGEASAWGPALAEGFREWAKTTVGYLIRMGPIMIAAAFASGLVIQWISPETVSSYLGNDVMGVGIAATVGILINVPLLFEIPLVALLLLLGMGTAPAATLLFTAAAGGPMTFWGLAKVMPRRAIAAFATATWMLGAIGGLAVLGIGAFIWEQDSALRIGTAEAAAVEADATPESVASPVRHVVSAPLPPGWPTIFAEVSDNAGVSFRHIEYHGELIPTGAGVVVFDFDGDGLDDIYLPVSEGPNALYRNKGDGTFDEVAASASVLDPLERGNGGCAADYDNDGDQDLYLTNYGASKLFRNGGDSTFADATLAAGLDDTDDFYRSMGCAWGDYDRDGHVDLIVVRHLTESHSDMLAERDFSSAVRRLALFHSNGDGTFTDVTRLLGDPSLISGITGTPMGNLHGAGFQPGWVDFDNDGDQDLYVVNDYGLELQANVLWRNDGPSEGGKWSFTDASPGSGADLEMFGMSLAVADYDLDGFLDLFVSNIADNVLLRNSREGLTFVNTAEEAGAAIGNVGAEERVAWGAVFFDYDNDGDEDLYVVSGYLRLPGQSLVAGGLPQYILEQPNVLLRNEGDGTFANVSTLSGADDPGIGRGAAFLDFNQDGCLDLFVGNLGQKARLFQNACGSGGNWLVIDTVGSASNRDGIGARITLSAGGKTQIREIKSGSSQMGQSMMSAHFGLGTNGQAESVTIKWPSGQVQTLADVSANQILIVTEPQ